MSKKMFWDRSSLLYIDVGNYGLYIDVGEYGDVCRRQHIHLDSGEGTLLDLVCQVGHGDGSM